MSHAALVNVGLWYIIVVQPILLVVFVWAVSRAPSGPPDSPGHPAQEPLAPQVSAPRSPEPAMLAAVAPWPPAGAVEQPGGIGYVGRHATRGARRGDRRQNHQARPGNHRFAPPPTGTMDTERARGICRIRHESRPGRRGTFGYSGAVRSAGKPNPRWSPAIPVELRLR